MQCIQLLLRDIDNEFLDAFREMFLVRKRSGVKMHINRLNPENPVNWSKYKIVMDALSDESTEGISFDIFPYNSKQSSLYMELPRWAIQQNILRDIQSGG